MRWLTGLAAALSLIGAASGCGGAGGDSRLPEQHSQTVTPSLPQRLAFVGPRGIGVLDEDGIEYVAELGLEETLLGLQWSGDGRQLAWQVTGPEGLGYRLEMVDLEDGSRQSWAELHSRPDPGLSGVTIASYSSHFTEYLPDGERRRFRFALPVPPDVPGGVPGTGVSAVLPFGTRWLVLAEHNSKAGRGGPVRAFLFDPRSGDYEQVAEGVGYPAEPVRTEDGDAIWIEHRSGSACLSADEIGAYGREVPDLPEREDERTWGISRVNATGAVSVLAWGTAQYGYNGSSCDGDEAMTWLLLEDGKWVVRERGLLDLDVAADGRIARVRGRICEESEACPESGSMPFDVTEATVEDPASGEVRSLPAGTWEVRFSPALPASAPEYGGSGPELSSEMVLEPGGLGPLRMGMTLTELQAGTSTPLTFELDGGCGTVSPTDAIRAAEIGVEGAIRGGRLAELTVTSLDRPAENDEDEDGEPDSLTDLQPGVGSIERRGPRIEGGIAAGDSVDIMLERLGPPNDQTAPGPTDAVDYSYELDDAVLLAHADGSGTLRRLRMRAIPTPPC